MKSIIFLEFCDEFFLESISAVQPACMICEYLNQGVCSSDTTCNCFNSYSGDVCQNQITTTQTSLQSSSPTNWTVIVAVISAIAGLLLIIARFYDSILYH